MTPDNAEHASDRTESNQKSITEELTGTNVGDRIVFNDRDTPHEVVEIDRYSVTVIDPNGNHVHISQNLQTGGWVAHEDVQCVDTIDEPDK